jgi:hypothetical protein
VCIRNKFCVLLRPVKFETYAGWKGVNIRVGMSGSRKGRMGERGR